MVQNLKSKSVTGQPKVFNAYYLMINTLGILTIIIFSVMIHYYLMIKTLGILTIIIFSVMIHYYLHPHERSEMTGRDLIAESGSLDVRYKWVLAS